MSKNEHDLQSSLERLLGPTGHRISCGRCFELIDQYVELELAGVDAGARVPGLRHHLDGCRACAEDHDSLHALVSAGTKADLSKSV